MSDLGRYLVFMYDTWYPAGGWKDYRASFVDRDDAIAFARKQETTETWTGAPHTVVWGNAHVIDLMTGEEVFTT